MRNILLALVAGFLISSSASAEMYRYVDHEGVVHYSDRPIDGAERVDVPGAQTFSNPRPRASVSRASPIRKTTTETFQYQGLQVVQPLHDGSVWNTAGQVKVVYSLQPRLRDGDRVRIYVDNEETGNSFNSLSIQLEGVERGTHQLRATVEDTNGRVVSSSDTTLFHYKQSFIRN